MGKFNFKLDPVLAHRKMLRDQKQRQLAALTEHRVSVERRLSQLHALVSQDRHRMSDGLVGVVDVSRIRDHAAHAAQVIMRASQITSQQHQLDAQISDARGQLIEAAKSHKVLEQLRDKRRAEWVEADRRSERKETDEVATQRYVYGKERRR
jgi:flagellar export protein FliJ